MGNRIRIDPTSRLPLAADGSLATADDATKELLALRQAIAARPSKYVELTARTNFSFLAGASPPEEWLLRPASGEARLSVHVVATDGQRFAAAGATADGALELSSFDLDFAGPAAFGPLQIERIPLGARTLQVALAPSGRARPGLLRFIAAQARSVADYFGQLPVDDP